MHFPNSLMSLLLGLVERQLGGRERQSWRLNEEISMPVCFLLLLLLLLHEKVLMMCFLILLLSVVVKRVLGCPGRPLLVNGVQSRRIVCDGGLGRHRER